MAAFYESGEVYRLFFFCFTQASACEIYQDAWQLTTDGFIKKIKKEKV